MLHVRRFLVAALGVLCAFGFAAAQEPWVEADPGTVSNWAAPPYWVPAQRPELEKLKESGVLSPMATEAVPSGPLPFFAIAPCRVVDTRPSQGFTGAYGPPIMAANAIRTFDINSGPCPGIPAGAEAYSLNFAVTETAGAPGDIRVFPTGSGVSITSVLNWNFVGNGAIANAIIIPAGTNGAIDVQVAGFNTHLVIDINGYYAPISIVNTVNGLSGAVTLAQGSNITITPSGNTLTIASTGGGSGWSLSGNAGTTPGTNFLGTTDNLALEIKVNNQRAMRFEPHVATMVPNVIGGSGNNTVLAGVYGATIAGGGFAFNLITDSGGTIGGGSGNQAGDNVGTTTDRLAATVAGGSSNQATGERSTVGGGFSNVASALWSTIAGGHSNQASGQDAAVGGGGGNNANQAFGTIAGGNNNIASFYAAVAGGANNNASANAAAIGGGGANTASGINSMIPGGHANTASGAYSFAAGRQANAGHDGAFVWGDSTDAGVASTAVNQFIVRASGGIWLGTTSTPSITIASDFLNTSTGAHLTIGGVWTNNSDVKSKENFQHVDRRDVLDRLVSLPITRWNYKAEGSEVEHLGPTAQDFSAAFGLGSDDRSITTLDSSGVALASIQALYEMVKEKDAEIELLKERLSKLEAKVE